MTATRISLQGDWQSRFKRVAGGHGIKIKRDTFRFAHRTQINLLDRNSLLWLRAMIVDEKPALLVLDTLRTALLGPCSRG